MVPSKCKPIILVAIAKTLCFNFLSEGTHPHPQRKSTHQAPATPTPTPQNKKSKKEKKNHMKPQTYVIILFKEIREIFYMYGEEEKKDH